MLLVSTISISFFAISICLSDEKNRNKVVSISNLSIIINPTKIFLHGRLFEDKMIFRQFKEYIERDSNFIGDSYFSNIERVPYRTINGAVGASARVIDAYFINE